MRILRVLVIATFVASHIFGIEEFPTEPTPQMIEYGYFDRIQSINEPFTDILSSEISNGIIKNTAHEVLANLGNQNFDALSNFIHPELGVRFTPYTHVREGDLVMNRNQVKSISSDPEIYLWGAYDGSGRDMLLTAGDYYSRFVYGKDFTKSLYVGYNRIISQTGFYENQYDFYDNPIVVEYLFVHNEDIYDTNWQSLRLVFQEYSDGVWYLCGIIHSEWTI